MSPCRAAGRAPKSSGKHPLLTGRGKSLRGEEGKWGMEVRSEGVRVMDGDHRRDSGRRGQQEPLALRGEERQRKGRRRKV